MFIFTNFIQTIDFERSQFQRMGVELTEFYLFEMSSLRAVIKGKSFQSSKSSIERIFLPLKFLVLLILYEKLTFSDHSFRRWTWYSLNFIYLCCLHCEYEGKVVLKLQKFRWTIFLPRKCSFLLFLYKILTLSHP